MSMAAVGDASTVTCRVVPSRQHENGILVYTSAAEGQSDVRSAHVVVW